LKKTNVHI
jgi:hypothetical protein